MALTTTDILTLASAVAQCLLSLSSSLSQPKLPFQQPLLSGTPDLLPIEAKQAFMQYGQALGITSELDPAQREAFEQCADKSLALIVGPPGTGKSYLGCRIARVLSEVARAQSDGSGPVLVVTWKNHALDEMLLDIAKTSGMSLDDVCSSISAIVCIGLCFCKCPLCSLPLWVLLTAAMQCTPAFRWLRVFHQFILR